MSQEALHIAQVFDSNYDKPNGVSAYINTLADEFRRNGHQNTHIVGQSTSQNPDVIAVSRTVPVPVNGNIVPLPLPVSRGKARRILEEVEPDVIHIGVPYTPFVGSPMLKEAGKETAVLGTFHVLPYSSKAALLIRMAGLASLRSRKRLDHVFAASPAVQEFAWKAFDLESTLLPCPVDIRRFKAGKRLPEYDDGRVNVMFLGRLTERKGAQHLIETVATLSPQERRETRVVIGGDGELRTRLEQLVGQLGLKSVVEFAGTIQESDKADFLASADITALPATNGESFGIVAVESMAAGGAVLAGDNAGYRTILGHRTPELLIDPNNHELFGNALKKLINNAAYRSEVVDRQQENIDGYDVRQVGRRVLETYSYVLEGKHR